ncbi:MAG: DUF4279 domain-containing protein [Myxococcales bacterium]|nr:DUF4279 domain-containing protein [Myxococcales bacterium]
MTDALRTSPTSSSVVGRVVGPNRLGLWRAESVNGWFLESLESVGERAPLEDHFDWIVGRVNATPEALRQLIDENSFCAQMRCVWWHRRGVGGGPSVLAKYLDWIGRSGMTLEFDLGGELNEE